MENKYLKVEDFPKAVTAEFYCEHKVILCARCKGFGFTEKEELVDYHKRDYATIRSKCSSCEGDGRLIEVESSISFNTRWGEKNVMPYASFKEFVEPHYHESRWCRWRIDNSDSNLERKYPELAAVNYDNYDKLVEHYRMIESLKQ